MIAEQNEKVEKALEEVERLMADKETWIQVERIREARMHQRLALGSAESKGRRIGEQNGIRIGKELGECEGRLEEKRRTIKNMMKEGLKDDLIAKVTGLSQKELQKQKELLGA